MFGTKIFEIKAKSHGKQPLWINRRGDGDLKTHDPLL
jgi:hypothetical protein